MRHPHSPRLLARLAGLPADRRGMAAVEFAMIVPIMVVLFAGVVEITNFVMLDKKMIAATQSAADLVAQADELTSAELSDILTAARLVMAPFPGDNVALGVASVRFDDDGDAYEDWSDGINGGDVPASASLAAGMGAANESVIIARMTYAYTPIFGQLIMSPTQLEEFSYTRPRTAAFIELN
ncbi:TadE/TadG family type IV pilus assembly protein [Roseospirillum parvum]|uniref:Flp pilus assembly protein TadG n=1 Tax=Roseospirillum parvum TaxID=83401 RepID=A0A1G8EHI5_9PROT|nr:TadE/TadG family type IV pilus assembly protein [Roseospirillum parvum]SDH69179.1 Flp pilus assembly protein TadG [Roseospirillum parvum]